MRVEYLIQKPHLRRYAELVVEFVTRVLRSDVLNTLGGVVVVDERGSEGETVDAVLKACQMVGVSEFWCPVSMVKYWQESGDSLRYSFGSLILRGVEKPVIMWVIRNTDTPIIGSDGYTLFHEFSHFMMYMHGLLESMATVLAEDSMFGIIIEELVNLMHSSSSLEKDVLKELIRVLKLAFVQGSDEVAADYIASNYFVLLNTHPYPYPARLAKLSRLGICMFYWPILCEAVERVKTMIEVKGYRISPRFAEAIERAISAFCKMEQVKMPRFVELLHSIFMESVRITPKELYLQEPERYSPIFYGIDWDAARGMGFPALDTLVAHLDIERKPLYEPYIKLLRG